MFYSDANFSLVADEKHSHANIYISICFIHTIFFLNILCKDISVLLLQMVCRRGTILPHLAHCPAQLDGSWLWSLRQQCEHDAH